MCGGNFLFSQSPETQSNAFDIFKKNTIKNSVNVRKKKYNVKKKVFSLEKEVEC